MLKELYNYYITQEVNNQSTGIRKLLDLYTSLPLAPGDRSGQVIDKTGPKQPQDIQQKFL